MDCDQVFMILTRGPFPTGNPEDDQVEDHLEVCADCWRLAEALRPADQLYQEAVPPSESGGLPGYWGDARPAAAAFDPLQRAPARTALAAGGRHVPQLYYGHTVPPLSAGIPVNLLRAAVLASALTVTAVGLLLLWHGW